MKQIISKILPMMVKANEILQGKDITSEEKSGIGNIVTATDKNLEAYLKKALMSEFPESQVISEESAEDTKIKSDKGLKFIVDPLDGTTNFTNGWPHSIAIGIINDKELASGIIYDVLAGKIYFSIKDNGVYVCNIDNILSMERVAKPEQAIENVKKAVISYDTPYGSEAFKTTIEMINSLYHAGASLKTVGPISLDILKTALGKENRPTDYNNAVWHTEVRAWDLAASTAILRELGGEIIGSDGKPISIEKLSSPTAKITFFASGNQKMLENLYAEYKKIIKEKDDEIR